jgi:hypothetical protein
VRGRPIHHPGLPIRNSTPRVSGFVPVIAAATRDKPALIAEVVVGRAIFCLLLRLSSFCSFGLFRRTKPTTDFIRVPRLPSPEFEGIRLFEKLTNG